MNLILLICPTIILSVETDVPRPSALEKSKVDKIDILIKKLTDSDSNNRMIAVEELSRLGPIRAKKAVPYLFKALDDSDKSVAQFAWQALMGLNDIDMLINGLQNSSLNVQYFSIEYLSKNGKSAKNSLPYLINHIVNKNSFYRDKAIETIGYIGYKSSETVQYLNNIFFNIEENSEIRKSAMLALIEFKDPDIILSILKKVDYNTKKIIVRSLDINLLKNESILTFINDELILKDPHSCGFNSYILEKLYELGPLAKKTVKGVTCLLKNTDHNIASSAARTLGSIGSNAKDAVSDLIIEVQNTDPYYRQSRKDVRRQSIVSLGLIGPNAKESILTLIRISSDYNDEHNTEAKNALKKIRNPVNNKTEIQKNIPIFNEWAVKLKTEDSFTATIMFKHLEKEGNKEVKYMA